MTTPVIFGEVLFDCFPDGHSVLGGAPFNVAWHLQAFGAEPLMLSRRGDDQQGDMIASAMEDWSMSTAGLQLDPEHPTGIVDIVFDNDEPRYTIVENSAWDFIDAAVLPALPADRILYHGSLALRNPVSRHALDTLKAEHAGRVFMDVNLRDPWWQAEDVRVLASGADWVKLNRDELEMLGAAEGDIDQQSQAFMQAHDLEGLVVTLGAEGALALTRDGARADVQPETRLEIVDTVGAGDAFTSVLMLGIINEWPLARTIQRAQSFASRIVGRRGATVSDPAFYESEKAAWSA